METGANSLELPPGRYGPSDLIHGHWFRTGSLDLEAVRMAGFRPLTLAGPYPDGSVPPLLILSLVEGLKQSGPVQITAQASLGWRIDCADPARVGDRLSARFTVTGLRRAGPDRAILRLAMQAHVAPDRLILTGETRLLMSSEC